MTLRSRLLFAAVSGAFAAALPAHAQEQEQPVVVGAPELRDFSLPGRRTTPPAEQQPAPEQTPPPAADARPEPAPSRAPSPQSAPQPARTPIRTPAPVAASVAPRIAGQETVPAADKRFTPPAADAVPAPLPSLAPPSEPAALPPAAEAGGIPILWPALGAGLALLLGLLYYQRRRRQLALAGQAMERAALAEAAPPPRPEPVQPRQDEEALAPVVELEFAADRMVATDSQSAIHFGLRVRNTGGGTARNVRIEARMFNASKFQEQEIAAFLASPGQSDAASAALTLQPQHFSQFRSQVAMPRENVREIVIEGRPLFIPTVVVRILYQWGRGRSDQAHGAWLIGIENPKSPEKMGPFRLDLGPRIYRSVGARRIDAAQAPRPTRSAA